jgi:hypothetical protein
MLDFLKCDEVLSLTLRTLSHGRLSRRRLVAHRWATGFLVPDDYEKPVAVTSVVLYGCETRLLIFKEECRLSVFENRV